MEDAGEDHRLKQGALTGRAEVGEKGVELEALPEVFKNGKSSEIESIFELERVEL